MRADADAMLMLQSKIISQDLFKSDDFRYDWLVLHIQEYLYNDYSIHWQSLFSEFSESNTSNCSVRLELVKCST